MPWQLGQGRDGGGIDAAADGHGSQAVLDRIARGQSVELGCAAHALFILRENQCLMLSDMRPRAYDRTAASLRWVGESSRSCATAAGPVCTAKSISAGDRAQPS